MLRRTWMVVCAVGLLAAISSATSADAPENPLVVFDFEEGASGWTGARHSSEFLVDEIVDWVGFCEALAVAEEGEAATLEERVGALLPSAARGAAARAAESGWISEDDRWVIVDALNGLLDRKDLCTPEMRASGDLDSVVQRFDEQDPAGLDEHRLRLYNRLLLEDAFRGYVEELSAPSNTLVKARRVSVGDKGENNMVLWARPFLLDQNAIDIKVAKEMDWRAGDELRLDLYATPSARGLQALVYVLDQDSLWYQVARPIPLNSGKWNRLSVDAAPSSAEWEPRGHTRPWCGYGTQNLTALGVKVFGERGVGEGVYLDDVTLTRADAETEPLRLHNFSVTGRTVPQYERFEIGFEINRFYDNPFDPDEIDIRGVFISPSGVVHSAPAFFYQDYERRLDRQVEMLTPRGRPAWRIRYAPAELGAHRYFLEVQERGEPKRRLFQEPREFTCVESDNPGYVRVSKKDWRAFEFENGDFFYPVGHNIPAAYNVKNAEALGLTINKLEGTFAYDRFLDGMGRAGENYARIWLASWSFGLEWSRAYSWEYRGLGQYNLRNAWRLDYVLDRCRSLGIYVQLALTTFGHYRVETFEGDWPFSPYNKKHGGPIAHPTEFWTCDVSQGNYQRMLRYVAARWGYATHIMSWEISNEIDLVTNYNQVRDEIADWHRLCVETLHRYDLGRHLVTTNFASWQRDPKIIQMPEISYSSTNRYARPLVSELRRVYELKSEYRKPALMAECGDDFKGSSAETTRSYIPISLWSAYMIPFAGGGMQWWWDFIDDRDLYDMFKPIIRFAEGEDRRDPSLDMRRATVRGGRGLGVECLGSKERAYFWVYEEMLLKPDEDWTPSPRNEAKVSLGFLEDGKYEVEFWHTMRGEVIARSVVATEDGRLTVELPEFLKHIAAKVKPVEAEQGGVPSVESSE